MGFICFCDTKRWCLLISGVLLAGSHGKGSVGKSDAAAEGQVPVWGGWFSCLLRRISHPGQLSTSPGPAAAEPLCPSLLPPSLVGSAAPHILPGPGEEEITVFRVTFFPFIHESPIRVCDSHSYT